MNNMEIKLTKEQLELLKQQIEKLQSQLSELDKRDYESHQKRLSIKNEIDELTLKLLSATTLKSSDNDFIELGSKFNATIDFGGSVSTDNYLISDLNIGVLGFIVISTTTPIAKAIIGKKVNDKFSYKVLNNKYNGVINSIYKGDTIESPKTIIKSK